MEEKKKLIGVYLPISLITRIKEFILKLYKDQKVDKSQSDIVREAVEKYLDNEEKLK